MNEFCYNQSQIIGIYFLLILFTLLGIIVGYRLKGDKQR